MTRAIGAEQAREFADIHELFGTIQVGQPKDEKIMDYI